MINLPGNTASAQQAFTGATTAFSPSILLRAGLMTCVYEKGWLRYLSLNGEELIRKVYSTVRDEHWYTVPLEVFNENILQEKNSFCITYDCIYLLGPIHYRGRVTIRGTAHQEISYVFEGEACSSFLRNRIGICVHLPIDSCRGANALIEHAEGRSERMTFPASISPYQPAFDIRSIWITGKQTSVAIQLEGDLFEMEDQRNWTDASFKIYSTPLSKPFPVLVKSGDTLCQSVVIQVKDRIIGDDQPNLPITILIGNETAPFPRIGYSKGQTDAILTNEQTALLTKIPFEHYRVDLHLNKDWHSCYFAALGLCEKIPVKLELALFFSTQYKTETMAVINILNQHKKNIHSILLLQEGTDFTPALLINEVMPLLSFQLQGIRIGIGTDQYFAEWNRNFKTAHGAGFTSYSINPQMHADDYATLIENLAAQAETVITIQERTGDLPVFISPLTLKPRYKSYSPDKNDPWSTDERQGSLFMAAWTCLSLKYLAKAQQVTLFELVGAGGIMPASYDGPAPMVYPVYLILQELFAFKPLAFVHTDADQPLKTDALTLINAEAKRLCILVNFTDQEQDIKFNIPFARPLSYGIKTLTTQNISPFLRDPSSFPGSGYQSSVNIHQNAPSLPAYSISFLKSF